MANVKLAGLAGAGFLLVAFGVGSARAGSVSFLGADLGDPNWRESSYVKPINPGGNNIYGNAGYAVLGSSIGQIISSPAGVTLNLQAPNEFDGNSGYTTIDDPLGPGLITSGVLYYSPAVGGQVDDYASLTFTESANYVIGIYTNNTDFASISPSSLRIDETVGGGADSGVIATNPNRNGDWFFFDVSGQAGDVFEISGIANPPNGDPPSDGIGVITFDGGVVPEPNDWVLLLAGAGAICAALRWRRAQIPRTS
jgi:hypothetical protein